VCPLLLIGQDNCDLIVAEKVIQVNADAPAISKIKMGRVDSWTSQKLSKMF
jgi:hypothetical protein